MADRLLSFKGSMIREIQAGHKVETRRILRVPEYLSAGANKREPIPGVYMATYGWDRESGATVTWRKGLLPYPGACIHETERQERARWKQVNRLPFWVGDRVAVREALNTEQDPEGYSAIRYHADGQLVRVPGDHPYSDQPDGDRWLALHHYRRTEKTKERDDAEWPWTCGHPVPPMHAPVWTSRITLSVCRIVIERLSAITEHAAIREGVTARWLEGRDGHMADRRDGIERDIRYGVDGEIPYEHRTAREAFRALWVKINGEASWKADPYVIVIGFNPLFRNISDLPFDPSSVTARLTKGEVKEIQKITALRISGRTYERFRQFGLIDETRAWTDRRDLVLRRLLSMGRY